jgi:acylphosphatase
MKAKTFRVIGKVQGVGFRWSAQEEAQRLGLEGWIRNDDDGSVCGLAQGDSEALERFAAWLRRGPRSAMVDRLIWQDGEPTALRSFFIRP